MQEFAYFAGEVAVSILQMSFQNGAKYDWDRDYYGDLYEIGLSNLTSECGKTLAAHNGFETMAIDQIASTIDFGPLEIYFCWRNPDGYRFGLKLHVGLHVGPAGFAPTWYVMSDHNAPEFSEPNWQLSAGTDQDPQPGMPYVWTDIPGVKITARPDAQHASLSIAVLIQGV
jgi:hypothetical protein